MKKIDEALDAARANPVRFVAWMLVLVVLCAAGFTIGGGVGHELYLYTH
jgi:hypothetical protein